MRLIDAKRAAATRVASWSARRRLTDPDSGFCHLMRESGPKVVTLEIFFLCGAKRVQHLNRGIMAAVPLGN
jgi:hypothetical protein